MKYKEAIAILKVARPTLYNYVKKGKIRVTKINHSLLDYNEEDVFRTAGLTNKRSCAVYARSLDSNNTDSQAEIVTKFAISNGYTIDTVYKDVCNGFTLNRPEFNKLINDLHDFKIKTIFILSEDILSIDSFNTLKKICELNHCEIVVISKLLNSDLYKEFHILTDSIFKSYRSYKS